MTHAEPSHAPSLNRQQRRRAEKQAKAARRGSAKGGAAGRAGIATAFGAQLQQAVGHHRSGAYAAAETIYRQVVESEPWNAQALQLLGALLNQTGRSKDAIPLLQEACKLAPRLPDAWNNLGAVYFSLGQFDEAETHYKEAIALKPDYSDAHRNLGIICYEQKRYDQARKHFSRALPAYAEDSKVRSMLADAAFALGDPDQAVEDCRAALRRLPDDPRLLRQVALILVAAKRYEEALVPLAQAIVANPDARELQRSLETAVRKAPPKDYVAELDPALSVCLDSHLVILRGLGRLAAQQIRLKYAQQARPVQDGSADGPRRVQMDGILGDQLLLRLLHKVVNTDTRLEPLLSQIRRALLFSACQQSSISRPMMTFMVALACQCHHNSYVFDAEPDETAEVNRLAEAIDGGLSQTAAPDAALETRLALFAMYRPLTSLAQRDALERIAQDAWTAELRPLIELTLLDRLEEAKIVPRIRTITAIDDEISRAVQSQYEENPYPRWIDLPRAEPCCFTDFLRHQCPNFDPPAFLAEDIEVLVAGCGTGQHPISTARLYRNARITAVDLSRASLAYATRMARRLGVENIEFYQGDILGLAGLGRQLPVIESSGVLHHMADPDAGLAVLTGLLRPGGVINLGLYSELARNWIVAARARIAELGLSPSAENITAFRRAIVEGRELPGNNLGDFSDFYDLDSCRDLIFHVQEHRFTIPLLKAFLARQSLRFIGFFFATDGVPQRFAEMFPGAAAAADLDCWQAFEEANPTTFQSMYQFWCQKPF